VGIKGEGYSIWGNDVKGEDYGIWGYEIEIDID